MPAELDVVIDVNLQVSFGRVAGDLIYGPCIETREDGLQYASRSCLECGGFITATASSSCGQTGTDTINTGAPEPLAIFGEEDVNVGDVYSAAGGKPPYAYEFSGGTISSEGVILSISGCGGGEVEVSYDCMSNGLPVTISAKMGVRLPGGTWQSAGYIDGPCGALSTYVLCEQISGFTMTR